MPCAVGWAGDVPGLDFGEAALQGDHEFSSTSFSPDALPASEVKGHTVDYSDSQVFGLAMEHMGQANT